MKELERDQELKLSELLRKLDELGYERVEKVEELGEFSCIGNLVEIFPVNLPSLVRMVP